MKRILILILAIILIWFVWAQAGRDAEWTVSESTHVDTEQIQIDSTCNKNIVAIQPYMLTADYRSEKHFYEKIKTYFEKARQKGYFNENTVVLLPEYIGTWLVIAQEKKSVAEAATIQSAMTLIVASNPIRLLKSLFDNQNEEDLFAASIFRMKSESMANMYGSVFKQLATEYNVTINAGSTVLPGPTVENNTIHVNAKEPLYNVSFVFAANGNIEKQVVKKSYPINSELPFIKPYPIEALPSFDLPIGKTSILVCADSWYPESYDQVNNQNAEVVLVASFCTTDNTMSTPWRGYDGGEEPADVDQGDIGEITEQEAWIKYALPGRLKSTKARLGVNIFLRGNLWDLGSDGHPLIVIDGELMNVKKTDGAGIYNICF